MAEQQTHLSKKELAHFHRKLLERLSEIVSDYYGIDQELIEAEAGSGEARIPRDLAELGSDAEQEDLLRALEDNERRELLEILAALERIDEGTYGICERTEKPIPKKRLEAIPWTRYTIEAAREVESETPSGW